MRVRLNDVLSFFDYIGWNPVRGAEYRWPSAEERRQIETASAEQTECPVCGGLFTNLSAHFYGGEHRPPPLPEDVKAVVAGCVASGGRVRMQNRDDRGHLSVSVADEDRLSWVAERLDWLAGSSYTEVEADAVNEQMAILAGTDETDGIEASAIQTHQTRSHHDLVAYADSHADTEPGDPDYRYPTNPRGDISGSIPDHPAVLGTIIALRGFIASNPDGTDAYLAVNPNRTRLSASALRELRVHASQRPN